MKNFTRIALLAFFTFLVMPAAKADQTWIDLDGSNDFLDFGMDNILAGKTQFTVEMKIHFDNSSGDYTIIGQRTSDANRTIVLQRWAGALYLFISNTNYGYCSFIPCSANYYHIAIVYDGTGATNSDRMKLYIDGVLQTLTFVGTVDPVSYFTSPAANLVLGCEHNGAATQLQYLDGQFGELAIWNYPLTQAEVNSRMLPEVLGTEPGLIEYFHFDNGIANGNNTAMASFAGGKGVSTITPVNMTMNGTSSNFIGPPALFNSVDTTYFVFDPTITSNASGATFQWLDCSIGYLPIPGATSQSFTAPANGSYACQVTQGACVDTTACVPIVNVGIPSVMENEISVYPNPVSDVLILEKKTSWATEYELLDAEGRLVMRGTLSDKTIVSTAHLSTGIYSLLLKSGKLLAVKKIIRE